MKQQNRCMCISHPKWEDKNTLNQYIASRAQKLRESTQGSTAMERGEGLTTLLDLKNSPWAEKPIGMVRTMIQEEVPFRPYGCAKIVNCCGLCTVKCLHRCVQDCYQRLYSIVWDVHVWNKKEDSVRPDVWAAYKTLMDPRTTYLELVETVNAFIERGDEHYANYTCEEEYYQTKGGLYRKKTDPETGEVILRNWPASGLCPYCVPRVLYHKVRLRNGGTAPSDRARTRDGV